jgi:predicted acyltransferase
MTTIEAVGQAGSAARDRPNRLVSLDALRGLAIAGMILVNSPGSWEFVYGPLGHAKWNGWTLADMVFPTFLFAMGAAMALGFPQAGDAGARARLWLRIARRTILLVGVGLFLNLLPAFDFAHLRIPGVLQRLGICYAIAAALCMVTSLPDASGKKRLNPPILAGAILVLLVGYWALMTFVPVPDFGAGRLDSAGNLGAYIDRAVFGTDHLWQYATTEGMGVTYDPEGLLSTLPATANVLIGILAGWMLKRSSSLANVAILAIGGIGLLVLGQALHPLFPINKNMWTSTFALLSSGFSLLVLALLSFALTWPASRRAAYPLRALGGNAILAYVLSSIMGAYAGMAFIPAADAAAIGAQQWAFETVSGFVADPYAASVICALLVLALITAILIPLERRSIHLRL